MAKKVTPFLMFAGTAEEAANFYTSLFSEAHITSIERYGAGEAGTEGSVKRGTVMLCGQEISFIDSPVKMDFTFTPASSLFVECKDEDELLDLFTRLSDGGKVLMPVGNYGFSTSFAWVDDRYGVSWQLNLE